MEVKRFMIDNETTLNWIKSRLMEESLYKNKTTFKFQVMVIKINKGNNYSNLVFKKKKIKIKLS